MADSPQPPLKQFHLRGFATTFRAFKCDEQALHFL
jgi:hypothetical protein